MYNNLFIAIFKKINNVKYLFIKKSYKIETLLTLFIFYKKINNKVPIILLMIYKCGFYRY